jgi:hypothetical protein
VWANRCVVESRPHWHDDDDLHSPTITVDDCVPDLRGKLLNASRRALQSQGARLHLPNPLTLTFTPTCSDLLPSVDVYYHRCSQTCVAGC